MLEEARVDGNGILRVRGWAVARTAIEQIVVLLDGQPLGLAEKSVSRDDVGRTYPDYPGSRNAGFLYQQEIGDPTRAGRVIKVMVAAAGGIFGQMTMPLAVPPAVERVRHDQRLVCVHCDTAELSEDGKLSLTGWAVCNSGVERIEVELDGHPAGRAETGLDRPDVGNQFPATPGARTAGFWFSGSFRPCEGDHVIRLIVRGKAGEIQLYHRSVSAGAGAITLPPERKPQHDIRCYLDTPVIVDGKANETVRGFMSLVGWAISPNGIAGVDVRIDGRSLGRAYFGIRREDIQAAFPDVPGSLLCGFAMLVPPLVMKKGRHEILVEICDRSGLQTSIEFAADAELPGETPGPWMPRQKLSQAEIDLGLRILDELGPRPWHELLLPVIRAGAAELKAARQTLAALRDQVYPNWRVTIAIAKRQKPGFVWALLSGFEDIGDRLVLVAELADFLLADLSKTSRHPALVSVIRPGDVLGADALLEMALAYRADGEADFIYSDERRIDPSDGVVKAFFKPDWSPDLMLSTNYIGRLWAATPYLLNKTGARLVEVMRKGEYDLVLRLTEEAGRIRHVAKVLCTRGCVRIDSRSNERGALARALKRRHIAAEIIDGCVSGNYRVKRETLVDGLVSIIIPTAASRGLIANALRSIRAKTRYRRFEIICLDNIAREKSFWKSWLKENADQVVEIGETFNWSRFNNLGANQACGEFLLFLNDDVEVLDGSWLDGLLEQAQRAEVGAVGPQLLYPDGKVQHAGMFLSRIAGRHAFRFAPRNAPGPFGLALTQRNVISVTGACLMVRRDVFEALGGFDEAYAIINNDVDFCLRVRESGRLVVYTPHVSLIHHEMVSRAEISDGYGAEQWSAGWRDRFARGDPYFSPHLAIDCDDYMPEPEPTEILHIGRQLMARERVRRIIVVKLDHIGDFVAAFAAFRRLKRYFPDAELTVLAASASRALASLEPAIDRIIEFNFFDAVSSRGLRRIPKKEWLSLQRHLELRHFDLAIDLRRQPDTRDVLRYTGAKWLAGFDYRNSMSWLDIAIEWEGDAAQNAKRNHVTGALFQLVDAVAAACIADPGGSLPNPTRAALPSNAYDFSGVNEGTVAPPARRLICVHAGAGAENKKWPAASFATLIDLLSAEDDASVVMVGSTDELPIACHILQLVQRPDLVRSLVGKTPLEKLPEILRACDLFIGNDSGPKHLAASLGVPTIGIHSGVVDATEWGPLGPAAIAIRRRMNCSPCYLLKVADCHRGLACLRDIGVGDVYRACRRMLTLSRGHRGVHALPDAHRVLLPARQVNLSATEPAVDVANGQYS
jgi:ADP-heptose:LPS heptosyltransferase/GT2 family glycosyltransferase